MQALNALMLGGGWGYEEASQEAYRYADYMLKAREVE